MRTYSLQNAKVAMCIFCTLMLLSGLLSVAAADTGLAFKAENGEVIRDVCEGGVDEIFILTSQRIMCLKLSSDGNEVINEIGPNLLDLVVLCATDDGLFGITLKNQFYEYQNSTWTRIGGLQAEYSSVSNNEATVSIRKLIAIGKSVYAILFDYTTEQWQCIVIQRDEKTCSVIPDLHPHSFCLWKNSNLIFDTASENSQDTLLLFNTGTQTISKLVLPNKPAECTALAYNPENDTIFATDPNFIVYSQAQEPFKKGITLKYVDGLVCIGGTSILVWSGDSIYKWIITDELAQNELVVMGVSTRFDNDFSVTSGISLQKYESTNMDVMEHISYALSSQDSTVDIYGFLTLNGLKKVKEKGMYIDLIQSQVLSGMLHELYPSLLSPLLDNGKIVAWPLDVQPLVRMQDDALLQRYGITPPETFDDLLDILPTIINSDILSENGMRIFDTMNYTKKDFMDYLIRQFIFYQQKNGEDINFNNDIFRHLTQRILSEVPNNDPFPETTGDEMPLFIVSGVSPVIQAKLLPPLKLSGDTTPAIETWMNVAVINPNSKHKEQALRYLEFIAQQKDENSYSYYSSMLNPYVSPYILDEIAKLTDNLSKEKDRVVEPADMKEHEENIRQLEAQIALEQENKYLVTDTAIQNYHQLAQMFIVSENSLIQYDNSLDELIDQLLAGRFTLDEFILACNQHVKMIYAESN